MGFTETHVTQMVEDHEVEISGYVYVRGDSESSRTGGVILYIDETIKFETMAIGACERNWWAVTVKLNDRNNKCVLMLVYHSPSGSDARFLDFLEEACNRELMRGSVIIMGDFNFDIKVNNYCQNKLVRIMDESGLKQMVKEPTRIVNNSETIIDLIFTNLEVEVKVKHEPKITDHSMVVLYLNESAKERKGREITCRDYKKIDMDKFLGLNDNNLVNIQADDVDDLADSVIGLIVRSLDEVAPKRNIIIRNKSQGKEWFTKELHKMIKQRDEAYKLARISKSDDKWKMYRQARNKVVEKSRRAKKDYWK